MPSANDINSDEYVGKLLAQDARNSSIKYSSMGLSALLPKRPTNGAPKPNTRFLQNILRETDSHNAALKKKEELEARLRLQNIRKPKGYEGETDGRERKRRRVEDDKDRDLDDCKRRPRRSENDYERSSRSDKHRHRPSPTYRNMRDEDDSYTERKAKKDRHKRSSRHYYRGSSRSSSPEDRKRHRRRRRSLSATSSTDRHRSRRHEGERERKHRKTHRRRASSSPSPSRTTSPPASKNGKARSSHSTHQHSRTRSPSPTPSSSSSDPLESIVGPIPPSTHPKHSPPPRGRGFHHRKNQIDTHFSPTYNPNLDLSPSSPTSPSTSKAHDKDRESEDWTLALEALRDRAIWKQKGAERLRAAGFGEGEVRRWQDSLLGESKGGGEREKGVEDVKWKGKGEEREWDVGKVIVREEGVKGEVEVVELEAAWSGKGKGKGGGLAGEMRRALG